MRHANPDEYGIGHANSAHIRLSSYLPAGGATDPLGEIVPGWFKAGFPDGFLALFAPAAALPAPVLAPLFTDEPVVEEPAVVPGVVAPPAVEPALGEPVCANASELVSASTVANPSVANFMIIPFVTSQSKTICAG